MAQRNSHTGWRGMARKLCFVALALAGVFVGLMIWMMMANQGFTGTSCFPLPS